MAFIVPSGFSWSPRPAYSSLGKIRLVEKIRRAFQEFGPPYLSTFDPDALRPEAFDIVGVGAMIRRGDGTVVLITRADFPSEGEPPLFLPGGGVEEDDASLEAACIREVGEETGLQVMVESLRLARIERRLCFCHFTCRELAGRLEHRGDPDAKTTAVISLRRVDLARVAMPADRLQLLVESLAEGDRSAAARHFLALADS